ncbi:hypothetical protein T484DRAFT_1777634 [Baffinella frigidus]|nr:hypothetical protein T484DRAFT_1777634 [Cryptophyta sp. CCMP2293]
MGSEGHVEGGTDGVVIEEEGAEAFSIREMSAALAVSATICWGANQIGIAAGISGWSIPIATLMTIAAATAIPGPLSSLKGAGEAAGVMFMQLFFA